MTVSLASWIRYQRAAMLNVLSELYPADGAQQGTSERVVIFKHALRNALLPTITLFGLNLPALFGGRVFRRVRLLDPGMGYLGINGFSSASYPTVMALTMITAVLVVLGNSWRYRFTAWPIRGSRVRLACVRRGGVRAGNASALVGLSASR